MPLPYPTGKLPGLDQRHRCVYHGRQLGRSGVTPARLPRKENSVRHQITVSSNPCPIHVCARFVTCSRSQSDCGRGLSRGLLLIVAGASPNHSLGHFSGHSPIFGGHRILLPGRSKACPV
jgi:hypothetical protein